MVEVAAKADSGCAVYRQKPIGEYIVDFYAPKARLVVEVDGSQHLDGDRAQYDAYRDSYLKAQGLRVLRFNNVQVLRELDAVLEVIFRELSEPLDKNPPYPPFIRGGESP